MPAEPRLRRRRFPGTASPTSEYTSLGMREPPVVLRFAALSQGRGGSECLLTVLLSTSGACQTDQSTAKPLVFILATIIIDMIGLGIIVPVAPESSWNLTHQG